jgi:hypothetical protein
MEVLPNLYVSTYDTYMDERVIKQKKIKVIIHVSKKKRFLEKDKIEEIRVPIDYDENDYDLMQINLDLYNYLYDIVNFIHEKLHENKSVLLLGYSHKQEVDIIVASYYIRFGKVTPKLAMYYLKTKKKNLFLPECLYEYSLERFYEDLNKK